MESLYLLIPIALAFTGIAVAVFLWAVRRDQFDDLDREAHRILFDDDDTQAPGSDHSNDDSR